MLCRKPYSKRGASFGCGQCMPCRINRRRIWAHRIILEALVSPSASFLTMTYDDEHLPDGGSLELSHVQLYWKSLRERGYKFRYFVCGEYGDQSERPHYHAALFGVPPCYCDFRAPHPACHCGDFKRLWGRGNLFWGDITPASALYIAGYVTKKMNKEDPALNGRYPEFARMSLRPGIGAGAMSAVAASLRCEAGRKEIARTGDVPFVLRHGSRRHPLGRYLRECLRKELSLVGYDTGVDHFGSEKVQAVRAAFEAGPAALSEFREKEKEKDDQKVKNLIARTKLKSGGRI